MNKPTIEELLLYTIYERKIEATIKRLDSLNNSIANWSGINMPTTTASDERLEATKKEFHEESLKLAWLRSQLAKIDVKIMVDYYNK